MPGLPTHLVQRLNVYRLLYSAGRWVLTLHADHYLDRATGLPIAGRQLVDIS